MPGIIGEPIEDFDLRTPFIKAFVKDGGNAFTQIISIFNSGSEDRKFIVEEKSNTDFFDVSGDKTINIGPREFGFIDVMLDGSKKNLKQGVYVGEVVIYDSLNFNNFVDVPVVLEIGTDKEKAKFGVAVEISRSSLPFYEGDKLNAKISVFNLEAQLDLVAVSYKIFSVESGDEVYEYSEILNVKSQLRVDKEFPTENLVPGSYVVGAIVKQGGSVGTAAEIVNVAGNELLSPPIEKKDFSAFIFIGVLVFLIGAVILLSYYWNRRVLIEAKDWRNRLKDIKEEKFGDNARSLRRLNGQKLVLDRAFASHYISEKSYKEGVREINSLMEKIKKRL